MTRTDVQLRARHADEFLKTATDSRALHADRTNVAISNAVLAGIAAADAICGHLVSETTKGDAHDEASRLEADESAVPHRRFAGLSKGGTVLDPLQKRKWGDSDGRVRDRFGVPWLIGYEAG